MALPNDIPEDIADRAAILMDELRHIEDDLEYTARIIMAVEAAGPVGLSKKQANALAFIEGFIDDRGYSPTFEEISQGLGMSSRSGAHRVVQQLIERGAVRRMAGRAQTIVIVKDRDVSTAHKNSEVA